MRISQIISSVDEEASGPSYTVPRLSLSLAELGHSVHLMTLRASRTSTTSTVAKDNLRVSSFARDFSQLNLVRRLGVSKTLKKELLKEKTDIYHTHGLWMMPNVYPALAARNSNKPLVLAPRGMLGRAALEFSSNTKRLFWALFQGRAARAVSCFHATCEEEYNDIRAFGLAQPVAVIPNGVDIPELTTTKKDWKPTVISLGRIHPKKALDKLIVAWSQIESDFPHWQLLIVGPDEGGYAKQLMQLTQQLHLKNVTIQKPVFGKEKLSYYRQSELFVLPTLHENFGMTVAESLAAGTPVISTKGAPWQGLEKNGCGWWIDHGTHALSTVLREAMGMSMEARREMGARGRSWMQTDFSWDGIAVKMVALYLWLSKKGKLPEFVRVD